MVAARWKNYDAIETFFRRRLIELITTTRNKRKSLSRKRRWSRRRRMNYPEWIRKWIDSTTKSRSSKRKRKNMPSRYEWIISATKTHFLLFISLSYVRLHRLTRSTFTRWKRSSSKTTWYRNFRRKTLKLRLSSSSSKTFTKLYVRRGIYTRRISLKRWRILKRLNESKRSWTTRFHS